MEYKRLSEVAIFSESRTKNINIETYISTENMLPNRGGICIASSIPDCKSTSKYEPFDILLSNIRPYFKKIWYANCEGSCSNDVLVLKAQDIDSKFLYYVLSDDNFFNYDTVTSKGTKMPRGSKSAIMKYLIPDISLPLQCRIASILSSYDNLIELNTRRIKVLEQMAENLYKEWFVRFRFPGYQTTPIENGIPKGWKIGKIRDVIKLFDSMRVPLSAMERDKQQKIYPYYGAAELMDYVENYLFDGRYLLMGEDGSVITPEGYPILQLVNGKFWVNNHAHVIQGNNGFSVEYLYLMFLKMNITGIVTGAAQPKISQGRLINKNILIPNIELREAFDKQVKPIFDEIAQLQLHSSNLTRQRDLLLPRLMSGQLQPPTQ